jgi:hypothetical protein
MHRNVHELVARVAKRRRLAALCGRLHLTLLVLLTACGIALLAIRLGGVMQDWLHPRVVLLLPVAALLIAGLWTLVRPRPDPLASARLIDRRAGTKDLFLTRVQLDRSAGEFQPLVVAAADEAAAQIAVRDVVPWRGGRQAAVAAALMLAVFLGTWLLPQLDPFGLRSADQVRDTERRAQAQNRAAAQQRLAALTRQDVAAEHSKPVTEAILALQKTLQGVRPKSPENAGQLAQQQKLLGEEWRAHKQESNARGAQGDQKLGGLTDPRAQKWADALRSGDAAPLQRELDELRAKARELGQSAATDQDRKRQELAQRLQALRDFARQQVGDTDLRDALARALQALPSSEQAEGDPGEALANLDQELELAQLELQRLAQSARDLAALEHALETLQLAKALDQQEALDGEACSQCRSLAEYAEMFRKAMGERLAALTECSECDGKGEGCSACNGTGRRPPGACSACNGKGKGCGTCGGTGRATAQQLALEQMLASGGMSGPNRGQAQGGNVGERPDARTDFTPERTRAALVAGRTLMQMKHQEPAQGGEVRVDRDAALQAVRAAVGEAILKEDVPPGYHDAVKGYFDKTGSGK